MDNLRGNFPSLDAADDGGGYDPAEDDIGYEAPPSPVGQDERRMQVRAYNHWASLLENRSIPSIEDLEPESLPDFGPFSVLLDFTAGMENPSIQFLGDQLAQECHGSGKIAHLSDVPARSLLSRITDHYLQIIANQAPIGFEAEFVNQRGLTILYRGILLPYSSDGDTIDFIYGVINWKELADQNTIDELLLEIDQALESRPDRRGDVMVEWADGPADGTDIADLPLSSDTPTSALDWPEPEFGGTASLTGAETPAPDTALLAQSFDAMGLADWLQSARALAQAATGTEDRSRQALYAAIGRAYDFSIAAAARPDEFLELVAEAGLKTQDRAPMTPVVKLVFGGDYDKTRLAEYASALAHGRRLQIARGELAAHLAGEPGGLKGVVNTERKLKRAEDGKPHEPREAPRTALARKLRKLDHFALADVSTDGHEFTLLVARRLPDGEVVLLGEVADDIALLERAARRLLI